MAGENIGNRSGRSEKRFTEITFSMGVKTEIPPFFKEEEALYQKLQSDFRNKNFDSYFADGHAIDAHIGMDRKNLTDRTLRNTARKWQIKGLFDRVGNCDSQSTSFTSRKQMRGFMKKEFGNRSFFHEFYLALQQEQEKAKETGERGRIVYCFDESAEKENLTPGIGIKHGRLYEFQPDSIIGVINVTESGFGFETVYPGNLGRAKSEKSHNFRREMRELDAYESLSPVSKLYLELKNNPSFPDFGMRCGYGDTLTIYGEPLTYDRRREFNIEFSSDKNGNIRVLANESLRDKDTRKWAPGITYDLRTKEGYDAFSLMSPGQHEWLGCIWNEMQCIMEESYGKAPEGILYGTEFEIARRPDVEQLERENSHYVQGLDLRKNPSIDEINKLDPRLFGNLSLETLKNLGNYMKTLENLQQEKIHKCVEIREDISEKIKVLSRGGAWEREYDYELGKTEKNLDDGRTAKARNETEKDIIR